MSLYREGESARFSDFDFELAQRFADAATIAIENARTREELRELGRRDELTGLLNRRGFNALLAEALEAAPASPVSLVLLDLDDFKSVNDRHGHVTGDDVLIAVARTLEQAAEPVGAVCRIGGDEFAVILRDVGVAAPPWPARWPVRRSRRWWSPFQAVRSVRRRASASPGPTLCCRRQPSTCSVRRTERCMRRSPSPSRSGFGSLPNRPPERVRHGPRPSWSR